MIQTKPNNATNNCPKEVRSLNVFNIARFVGVALERRDPFSCVAFFFLGTKAYDKRGKSFIKRLVDCWSGASAILGPTLHFNNHTNTSA